MIKKYKSLVVIAIILIAIVGANGCSKNSNSNKSDEKNTKNKNVQNTDDSEAHYEATLVEVQKINDNSDLLGAVLLSEPEEGMMIQEPKNLPLDDEGNKGEYYESIYHGEAIITQIYLESSDANVLGIRVGDDKQVITDKLKDSEYEQSESAHDNYVVYKAYHVILSFELSGDGKIVSILVNVYDPTEVIPTF